jgi:hypothetical protein
MSFIVMGYPAPFSFWQTIIDIYLSKLLTLFGLPYISPNYLPLERARFAIMFC